MPGRAPSTRFRLANLKRQLGSMHLGKTPLLATVATLRPRFRKEKALHQSTSSEHSKTDSRRIHKRTRVRLDQPQDISECSPEETCLRSALPRSDRDLQVTRNLPAKDNTPWKPCASSISCSAILLALSSAACPSSCDSRCSKNRSGHCSKSQAFRRTQSLGCSSDLRGTVHRTRKNEGSSRRSVMATLGNSAESAI